MATLFVLDVEDFTTFWQQAKGDDLKVTHQGTYVRLDFANELVVDRVSTGLRHAVWYSAIAGVHGAHVEQFDKVQLKLVANG